MYEKNAVKTFTIEKLLPKGETIPVCIRQVPQESSALPHQHDFVEIVLVRTGFGMQNIHNPANGAIQTGAFIRGDVFSALPGEIHSYNRCHDFAIYNICIGEEYLYSLSQELSNLSLYSSFLQKGRPFRLDQFHLSPLKFERAEFFLQQLKFALLSKKCSRQLAVKTALMNLLLHLFDAASTVVMHKQIEYDEQLFALVEQMEAGGTNYLTIQDCAKKLHISNSSFSHKFKNAFGVSPDTYFKGLRLEKIRQRLLDTSDTLQVIAEEYGFCDANYLVIAFKKKYGISPGQFRSNNRLY